MLQNAGAEVGKSTALEDGGVARAVEGVRRRLDLSADEPWSRGAELNGEQTKVSRLEPVSAHATQRSATQPAELLLAALREPASSVNRFDGSGSFLGDLSPVDAPNFGPSYLGKLDELDGEWAGRGGMLGKLDWDGFGQERAAGAASATSLPTTQTPSPLSLTPADLLSQQQQGLELDTGNAVRAGTDTTLPKGREPPTVVTHQRVPDQGKVPDLGRDHGQDRDQGLLPG